METNAYLDGAFERFSGYIAVDEVYDGPFCILSLVDNRTYKRLLYRVLPDDPNSGNILELRHSFHRILSKRDLILHGITTDGERAVPSRLPSASPPPPPVGRLALINASAQRKRVLATVRQHQTPRRQVVKKSVLKAVAQVRRELEKTKTKRNKRGRPSTKEEKATIRKNERIQTKIGALFDNRYLFVQKELTPKERETLKKITRGLPELRKLREIVDEMYGLYDRRCRRGTAWNKLRKLRQRLKRFKRLSTVLKKLESPTVDRSLIFLDDKPLPSTSNAVERGNRRFRKMQKTVDRVRTCDHLKERVALDMFRDSRFPLRRRTIQSLHDARTG